jgi:putative ABC transport system substrate-binding protein
VPPDSSIVVGYAGVQHHDTLVLSFRGNAVKRRDFLLASATLVTGMPHAMAQQPATKKRIAVIGVGNVADLRIGGNPDATVFFEELKRLGYSEGDNLIVERYSTINVPQDRQGYIDLAREVVGTQPDVIVSYGMPMTATLKAATSTIPIVAFTGDPIRFGLKSSLAHPGGNITGVSVDAGIEIWAKRLELLSEAVPKLVNVAFVSTQGGWDGAGGQAVREAAQKLGISLVRATLNSPFDEAEYRRVLGSIQRDQVDGIFLSDEFVHYRYRLLVVQLVQQMRIPAVFPSRDQAEAGGLMAYSYDGNSALRRQVMQIVAVLRGANPGDIPYFQETRFELVINLKTAKELGLEIPAGLVAGATVIE